MALSDQVKLPALHSFHEDIYKRGFKLECGYGHYKLLMAKFDIVVEVFLSLDKVFQVRVAERQRFQGC